MDTNFILYLERGWGKACNDNRYITTKLINEFKVKQMF